MIDDEHVPHYDRIARESGSLNLMDEIFLDLRRIDLHLRLGRTALAREMIAATRQHALRSASPELVTLLDAREAGLLVRIGDLDRARDLVESAEAGLSARDPFGGEHGRALVGAVRGALCLELGDGRGAS